MTSEATKVYVCPEHVTWVTDTSQVIAVDQVGLRAIALHGAEAALWGWLALATPYDRLVALLTVLLAVPRPQAEDWMRTALERWCDAGLLVASREASHG